MKNNFYIISFYIISFSIYFPAIHKGPLTLQHYSIRPVSRKVLGRTPAQAVCSLEYTHIINKTNKVISKGKFEKHKTE